MSNLALSNVGNQISTETALDIDTLVSSVVERHKTNSVLITRLTMDSVMALTSAEARSNGLARQRFLGRLWGNLTGVNDRIRTQIQSDLVVS